jgi:hypothetical protein
MSGFTPVYGFPFPGRKDAPGLEPEAMQALAAAVESILQTQLAALTARLGVLPVVSLAAQNALTGLFDGFTIWRTDIDALVVYDGAGWRYFRRPSSAVVATQQQTTSTSYTDLGTVGPAVTLETGAAAKVTVTAASNTTAFMGFAISGATTRAATDTDALRVDSGSTSRASMTTLVTGLTPGSNTFTAKYRVIGGTGTWLDRAIIVEAC